MKRKMMSLLLAAVMVVSMVAGCGSEKSESTKEKATNTNAGLPAASDVSGDDKKESTEVEKIKIYVPTAAKFDDLDKVIF